MDLAVSLVLLGGCAVLGLAYGVRVARAGAAHYTRVDQAGSSALLGKGAMEMAYWTLQPIARACVRAKVSANAVTLTSLALAACAGVALAYGRFGIAAGLAAVSSLGDALDGLVARMSKTASDSGEMLDAAVDRYGEFFYFSGLAVFYRESAPALLLVLASIIGSFMVSYATARAEALGVIPPRGAMRRAERAFYLTLGAGLVPCYAAAAIQLGFATSFDMPLLAALALVALVANVSAVRRLLSIARLAREKGR